MVIVRGCSSPSRSMDAAKASNYGLTPGAIAQQVAAQVNGIPGGSLRVENRAGGGRLPPPPEPLNPATTS